MATPLISIVIPSYNHESFVTHCLNCVLNDDYPNKEIIVLDDGSKDRTLVCIQEWAQKHGDQIPITVRTHPNKGVTKTLNEGLSLARGALIVPIASDDYLLPGGLRARADYLAKNPSLLAVFGDAIVVDNDGKKIFDSALRDFFHTPPHRYASPKSVADEIAWRWALPGPVLMARRELYEIIGGYDERLRIEDWDLFLRMAARETLGFLDKPVAAYRWHSGNATRGAKQRKIVLHDLALSGFRRQGLFNGKRRIIVLAKALYYWLKMISFR